MGIIIILYNIIGLKNVMTEFLSHSQPSFKLWKAALNKINKNTFYIKSVLPIIANIFPEILKAFLIPNTFPKPVQWFTIWNIFPESL